MVAHAFRISSACCRGSSLTVLRTNRAALPAQSHQAKCCSNRRSASGSTSAAPPQTSQRHWPLPWHCPQIPTTTPAKHLPPKPLQAGHEMVLWPWHLGHRMFVGIARPLSSNCRLVAYVSEGRAGFMLLGELAALLIAGFSVAFIGWAVLRLTSEK